MTVGYFLPTERIIKVGEITTSVHRGEEILTGEKLHHRKAKKV